MGRVLGLLLVLLAGCQGGPGGRPTDDVCIGICQYTQVQLDRDDPPPPPRKKRVKQ